jgi:methyl-accepting chemotaxis protein
MEMAASVNNISQNIEKMSSSVIQSATSIENMINGIHNVTESSESMLESAEGTQERLEHLETSMRNVLAQINKGGISAEEIIKNTQRGLDAFSKSQDGLTRIEEMVRSTRESIISLSRGSEDIGDIVGIINEIADQTNLLSLNAAIIAASAGEHGRSFAVVADEIRELSERTQTSTRDIAKVIRTVQTQVGDVTEEINIGSEKVEEGLELAAMAGQILSNIYAISEDHYDVTQNIASTFDNHFKETNKMMEGVQDLATKTRQITLAMREQKLGSQLILSTIEDIQEATKKTVVSINEHSKGSQALSMSMEDLAKRVEAIFKAIEVIRKGVEKIINEQEIIRYATSETLVGTRKLREIFQEIELESEELESLVKQFKTKPPMPLTRKENGLKPKETEEII